MSKMKKAKDVASVSAMPDASSSDLAATIVRLRARRDQVEDRLQQIGAERHRLMVDGAPDEAVNRLREEHRNGETEIDDLEAAIKLAEQRRESALVRERRAALEARAEHLRAEVVPEMLDGYRRLYKALSEFNEAAAFIVGAERELHGHNAVCVAAKRNELRVSCDARQSVSDEVAGIERASGRLTLKRNAKETDDAFELRQLNAEVHIRERGTQTNVFRVLGKKAIDYVLHVAWGYDDTRRKRVQITEVMNFVGPNGPVTKYTPLTDGFQPSSHGGIQRDGSYVEVGFASGGSVHRGPAAADA